MNSNEVRTEEGKVPATTPEPETKTEEKPGSTKSGSTKPNGKANSKAAASKNGSGSAKKASTKSGSTKPNGKANEKSSEKDSGKDASKPKARTTFAKATVAAVAQQCWWKRTSKSRLATDYKLTEEEVDNLRGSQAYREAVESLMVGQRSDPAVFADWHKTESIKPEWLSGRMGIEKSVVVEMFKAAKSVHAKIVAGDLPAPKYVPSSEGKVTEYKVSDEGKITSKRVAAS